MAVAIRSLEPHAVLKGEQKLASDPAEHVWLSASAGTGKTYVLSARVLRLLLRGIAPDAILCLTFTKAGAAEMAERVHERLAHWVRLDGPLLGAELKALDEDFGPESVSQKYSRRAAAAFGS
jgi:ATP-dependent helicase/nuclease subunit A